MELNLGLLRILNRSNQLSIGIYQWIMHRDSGGDLFNSLEDLKSLPLADFYKLYLVDSMNLVHETTHLIPFLISDE